MNNIEWHYRNYHLQYSFLPYLHNREFVMLKSKTKTKAIPIRNLRVHNIQSFHFIMDRIGAFRDGSYHNLYYSMARFKEGIPFQDLSSLSTEDRKNKEWNEQAHEHICAYDMLIDIDCGDHSEIGFGVLSATKVKRFLDDNDVPYYLRFSGMGFHFVIPDEFFKPFGLHYNPYMKGNIYDLMRIIAKKLNEKYSEMIDFNIYDSRRISKLPYSLSIYDDVVYCCKPIDTFYNFDLTHYKNCGIPKKELLNNPQGNLYNLRKSLKLRTKWQSV